MTIRFCLLLLISFVSINGQSIYFVKFRDNVQFDVINNSLNSVVSEINSKPAFRKSAAKFSQLTENVYVDDNSINRIFKITLFISEDEDALKKNLTGNPNIEYIEKATQYKIDYSPDDSLISEQYALNLIGAYDAWDITTGDKKIIIAVIDTGIDYLHFDLAKNIWVNEGEDINGNGFFDESDYDGIDNDNNGFIDDIAGWDFTDRQYFPDNITDGDYKDRDADPSDEHGHGTNVAGIIGAEINNGRGIAGIAPNVSILNLKAFDPNGFGEEDDVAAAIIYAVASGAQIINMSFGDDKYSNVLRDVIRYAYNKGVIIVASSGNSSSDEPHYPSGFSEVICVGASDQNDNVASFSNTGSTIDLTAPGLSILTTGLDNTFESKSGTSVSAPFVSAAASLILSQKLFNNEEVKQILKSTSDDIDIKGWDDKSGAGRLNLFKALNVPAASKIKFKFPSQDYSTDSSHLPVIATVLSPYFSSFSLKLGEGFNPVDWEYLVNSSQSQVYNENIYTIDLSSRKDTVYTLSLEVTNTNGRTTEERLNFFLDHTPPVASVINILPAFLEENTTILASVVSDDRSLVKMNYREKGTTNYQAVTLDGFSPYSNFVRQKHFGFLPYEDIKSNTEYELFFEVVNIGGLTSTLNNNGNNYIVKTDSKNDLEHFPQLQYTLEPGRLYRDIIPVGSDNIVAINPVDNSSELHFYKFENNNFVYKNKISERILKSAGDFNKNGKIDLLNSFVRKGYIDEFIDNNQLGTQNLFSDTTGTFWPVLARDIDNDGETEIVSVKDDTTIVISQVAYNGSLNSEFQINNFSDAGMFGNLINSSSAAVRLNNEQHKSDIWFFDAEGELFSYDVNGSNSYSKGSIVETGLDSDGGTISAGDIDGDGIEEIAVLLKSDENYDIAPFNYLLVFNLVDNKLNVLMKKAFIDLSSEISTGFQNVSSCVRLFDIDNDGLSEIVVFAYPSAYVFDDMTHDGNLIQIENNTESKDVFIGDLNKNGAFEIAFPHNDKVIFKEFTDGLKPAAPSIINGYSLSSKSIYLSYSFTGEVNYIFRSNTSDGAFSIIDSSSVGFFTDTTVNENTSYFYYVTTRDNGFEIPFSEKSSTVEIYSHKPAVFKKIIQVDNRNIAAVFDTPISEFNLNLESILVDNSFKPSSISYYNTDSYLISFNTALKSGAHNIFLSGLTDKYNSYVADTTVSFEISNEIKKDKLFIEGYKIIDAYTLSLELNLELNTSNLLDKSNYVYSPVNPISNVSIDHAFPKRIIIKSSYPVSSVGNEYLLQIANISSSAETGSLPIEEGAGSYIVISSNAENLDDIYAYPNPVRLSDENVTFANLTNYAEIRIYDLHGKNIYNLEEKDGNGGVSWDLTDLNGNKISSGIYVYFVRSLNSNGDILQEKKEKIAVIK